MAVVIGPTFPAELRAAGLPLDGIAWDTQTGTLTFGAGYTSQQKTAAATVLVAHDPAMKTVDQQLGEKIAAGITIAANNAGVPEATFALDAATQADLNGTGGIITLTGSFPGGAPTFVYPDINSAPQVFPSIPAFKSFMSVYSALLLGMQTTANLRKAGQQAQWPSQTVTPT